MSIYCGRFAPSPTGPLHLGSLFAALVSYAHARHHQGKWLLRIEDIDPPREQPGAVDEILRCLETHGFQWDELSYQSAHNVRYEHTLQKLCAHGLIYACPCSRRDLNENNGKHRPDCPADDLEASHCALRIHSGSETVSWQDGFQGTLEHAIEQDFVIRRRDGLWSYQLACVTDDAAQGVNHVVRGSDLIASTPMQVFLYRALGWKAPLFFHFPVLTLQQQKLSKQSYANPVDHNTPVKNLHTLLELLGFTDLSYRDFDNKEDLLNFASEHILQSPVLKYTQLEAPGE